jgi:hypothetical protein
MTLSGKYLTARWILGQVVMPLVLAVAGYFAATLLASSPYRQAAGKADALKELTAGDPTRTAAAAVLGSDLALPTLAQRRSAAAWQRFYQTLDATYLANPAGCLRELSSGYGLVLLRDFLPATNDLSLRDLLTASQVLADGSWKNALGGRAMALLEKDPEKGLELVKFLPVQLQGRAMDRLGAAYVAQHGDGSLNEIMGNRSLPWLFFDAAFHAYCAKYPEEALRFAASIDSPSFQAQYEVDRKTTYLSEALTAASPESAIKTLLRLPDSGFKNWQLQLAIGRQLEGNPAGAGVLIEQNPTAIPAVMQAAISSHHDPDKSAVLLNALPGERSRTQAARAIARQFAPSEAKLASKWLEMIADPVTRAQAMSEFQRHGVLKKPAEESGPSPAELKR